MSMIQVQHLTFAYEGSYDSIFEDVSFQIDTDWRLGFTGRNGRGKTTFLKLLMGEYEYRGSITASVEFDYFPYEVANPSGTALDAAEEWLPDFEYWKLVRELALLEVDEEVLYRPFETLSNGEQTKMLLAVLFLRENHFLLIDEPTNHLDIRGREVVGRYLRGKNGFLLVSHDRTFLDACIDHILSINKTDIEIQQGNFSSWQQNMEYRLKDERDEQDRLKRDIRHLSEAARRTAGWSDQIEKTKTGTRIAGLRPDRGHIGHQSAKMMKRAKTVEARREKAVREKADLLKNVETAEKLILKPLIFHCRRMLEVTDLVISYDDRKVCGPLSFTVSQGERIALCGRNGSGKSSILKLLNGQPISHGGDVEIPKGLRISYVAQDPAFLTGYPEDYAVENGLDTTLFYTILRKLDFSRTQFEKRMEHYSLGQKKKVLLAASLCTRAHLYIWDEPLNYVDVLSRIQLENLIREFSPTMLVVEHDRAFLEGIEARVINL